MKIKFATAILTLFYLNTELRSQLILLENSDAERISVISFQHP